MGHGEVGRGSQAKFGVIVGKRGGVGEGLIGGSPQGAEKPFKLIFCFLASLEHFFCAAMSAFMIRIAANAGIDRGFDTG